jgi:hypothetical protein
MGKFHQYARIAFVGGLSVAIVVNEQHLHIHQEVPVWPGNGYGLEAIVNGTSTSTSISG